MKGNFFLSLRKVQVTAVAFWEMKMNSELIKANVMSLKFSFNRSWSQLDIWDNLNELNRCMVGSMFETATGSSLSVHLSRLFAIFDHYERQKTLLKKNFCYP